jgi:hypothetical protein
MTATTMTPADITARLSRPRWLRRTVMRRANGKAMERLAAVLASL